VLIEELHSLCIFSAHKAFHSSDILCLSPTRKRRTCWWSKENWRKRSVLRRRTCPANGSCVRHCTSVTATETSITTELEAANTNSTNAWTVRKPSQPVSRFLLAKLLDLASWVRWQPPLSWSLSCCCACKLCDDQPGLVVF